MYSCVHNIGTLVNVDCVHGAGDNRTVSDGRTTGEILRSLMVRAGFSVRQFAQAAGYKFGSGVQRYIEADYEDTLPLKQAQRFSDALAGRGDPPIGREEVMALTGVAESFEATGANVLPPRYRDLARDVPVYGTALGTFAEGEVIEQTMVEMDTPIDYFLRPVGLAGRTGVYGLYVTGDSQSPRFEPGEVIFVDPQRPPMIGDDVVLFLKRPEGDGEAVRAVLIKRLVRRGRDRIELRQLNPFAEFSVDSREVMAIHRVLTSSELWGGYR